MDIIGTIIAIAAAAIIGILLGDLIFIGPLKFRFGRKNADAVDTVDTGNATGAKRSDSWSGNGEGETGSKSGGHSGSFNIPGNNRLDRQTGPSCAGYAAAYLLRSRGINADGNSLYESMRKVYRGNVQVVELRRKLRQAGIETDYCRGDKDALRDEIDRGVPVIMLLKAKPDSRELHFLCAVGYDEEGLHLADSARNTINLASPGEMPYNRTLPWNQLDELWNTGFFYMPFHRNTYISIAD